jgi:Co/Zn/Cd efflux system component
VLAFSSTDFIVQMHHKSGLLVALISLVAHVVSTYIMDDRNASISYSPSSLVFQGAAVHAYDDTLSVFFCAL